MDDGVAASPEDTLTDSAPSGHLGRWSRDQAEAKTTSRGHLFMAFGGNKRSVGFQRDRNPLICTKYVVLSFQIFLEE